MSSCKKMGKIIIVAVLLLAPISGATLAQNKSEPKAGDTVIATPPEPDKDINRKIWEEYYTAELNYRYHLKQAAEVASHGAQFSMVELIAIIIAWAAPFVVLIRHYALAVTGKNQQERLAKVAESSCGTSFWIVSAISIVALIVSLVARTAGHSDRSVRHMALSNEWDQLSQEWNELRQARGQLPPKELEAKYRDLIAKQGVIKRHETPDLYDEDTLRQVQNDLNKFLKAGQNS